MLVGASCIHATKTDTPEFQEDIASLSVEEIQIRSDIPSIASSSDITNADALEYGESVDEPVFVSMNEAKGRLREDGLGILVEIGSTRRYYPFQLLQRHAVVNDVIGSEYVMITYCSRCGTGIVFQRTIDDNAFTFGVSGKLYENNLLMYNKDGGPQSLWSQAQGKAILGALAGTELEIVPSEHVRWSELVETYEDGDVEILANGLENQLPLTPEEESGLCSSTK